MSSASLRTSPAPAPSARWPTNETPKTSLAPSASCPAAASTCWTRTRSISFSAVRSRSTRSWTRSGSSSGRALSASLKLRDEDVLARQEAVGVAADERLHASYAGPDGRLAEQLDHAELAGPAGVRAAAELARPVADGDHADLVAVLLAEQRHRPGPARLVLAHDLGVHGEVGEHEVVDPGLDVGHRRRGDGTGRGEVEAEPAGRVLRARLGRGVAERLAERLVHHVGRGVRAADRAAPLDVDERLRRLADRDLAGEHRRLVHDQAA